MTLGLNMDVYQSNFTTMYQQPGSMQASCSNQMPLQHSQQQQIVQQPLHTMQPFSVNRESNRPIAPAPPQTTTADKRKAKMTYAHVMPFSGQPASVVRRNARERNRVKQVNNGFATLRQHIPPSVVTALSSGGRGASKKLSKVDTLKIAVEYICRLQDLLSESESDAASTSSGSSQESVSSASYYESAEQQSHHLMEARRSEASVSPSPSFESDSSISGTSSAILTSMPYKYENYENYNPISPEDEELLDCITWWQTE